LKLSRRLLPGGAAIFSHVAAFFWNGRKFQSGQAKPVQSVIAGRSKPLHSKQNALMARRGEHFPDKAATKWPLAD
jgi:hypothetical protein